jgi:putative lipoprotein
MLRPVYLTIILLPILVAACAAPATSPKPGPVNAPKRAVAPLAKVAGTVTYRQRIALTPEAVVTVRLSDVSRQDVPAMVLAEQIITRPGQIPIPFELDYDPESINPAHRYAVQARIEEGGKALFVSDTVHFVLTHGNPSTVEIAVVPAQ